MLNAQQITAIQSALHAQGFFIDHEPNGEWSLSTQAAYAGYGRQNNLSSFAYSRQPDHLDQVPVALLDPETVANAEAEAQQRAADAEAAEQQRLADEAERLRRVEEEEAQAAVRAAEEAAAEQARNAQEAAARALAEAEAAAKAAADAERKDLDSEEK